jgi:protein transport protein HofQ
MSFQEAQALEYILIKINHRSADELINQVKPLLSDTGKVTADVRTNSLLVVDRRENLDKIEEFVALIDKPSRSLRIKATFFDENIFNDLNLGVNWNYSGANFTVGNVSGITWGSGLYLETTTKGGVEKSQRLIVQNLLIISGSTGEFITGKSVPIDERVIVYFNNWGIQYEGVVFRDVSTGFKVTPTVLGSGKIRIDIEPFLSYFADGKSGEIIFKEIKTSVVVANGEDVVIATNDVSGSNLAADIFSGFSSRNGKGRYYFTINVTIKD